MFFKCFKLPAVAISIFLLYACSSSGGGESTADADNVARFDPSSYREAPDSGNLTGSWIFLGTDIEITLSDLFDYQPLADGRTRSIVYIVDNGDGTGTIDRCNPSEPQAIQISDGKIVLLEDGIILDVYNNSRIGGDYLMNPTIFDAGSSGHIEAIKVDNSLNHNFGQIFNINGVNEYAPVVSNASEVIHCFYEEYSVKTYFTFDSNNGNYKAVPHTAPYSVLKIKSENYLFRISERRDSTGFNEFAASAETPWGNFGAVEGNNPDRKQTETYPIPDAIYKGTYSAEYESTVGFVNSSIYVTNGGDLVSAESSVQF